MEESGARKLEKARFGTAGSLSAKTVEHLIDLAERDGVRIVDWTIRGQPAIDALSGTLVVPIDQVGRVVQDLVTTPGARVRLRDFFPHGIPKPDLGMLTFSVNPTRF